MTFNYTRIDKEFLRVLGTIDHVTHLRLFSNEFWPCTNLGQGEMRIDFFTCFFLDATTQVHISIRGRVRPSVRPSVPSYYLSWKTKVFKGEKSSIVQNINDTVSDGEVLVLLSRTEWALIMTFF